jgi:hypothetical protein
MGNRSFEGATRPAASVDVSRTLGDLDDIKVAEILASRPSLADLEDVAICMAGDQDILAANGHRVSPTAARIIELLADEEEEPEESAREPGESARNRPG